MAETGRERELKLGVPDRDALRALIEAAGGRRELPVLQINHFFDSADGRLRRQAIGFRIRIEGDQHILTVKGPTATRNDGLLSDRIELESTLPAGRGEAALAGNLPVIALLDDVGDRSEEELQLAEKVKSLCADAPPTHLGSFRNERTRVATELAGTPVVLEFDHTLFSEHEERCEVELELDAGQAAEPLAEALYELFARAGVEPVPTTSKLARFLRIIGEETG